MDRPGDVGGWTGIEVHCPCGHFFRVARSLKGGMANCPRCGKAADVPGGPEGLFWLLLGLGTLVVVLVAACFFAADEWATGLAVLGVGGLLLLIRVLAS